ncbi:MAG TPA: circadian clock KaiB family protein [Flavobacterium sp.]
MEESDNNPDSSGTYRFILFISGMSIKSGHAIENFRKICDKHLAGRFQLQIVDITRDKHLAMEHQIIAVPTLIKIQPAPRRIILGDLSETKKVLKILDIN